MISGDGWSLSFPDICLTVEEKPRKKPQPEKTDPTKDRTRALDHSCGQLEYSVVAVRVTIVANGSVAVYWIVNDL